MAKEIERKFLVDTEKWKSHQLVSGDKSIGISQGYLFNCKGHVGRVRVNSKGLSRFTYKGPTKGVTRTEIEFPIPFGRLLLKLCDKVIHKTRTIHKGEDGRVWEVDEFHNLNQPLLLAEIELETEYDIFDIPFWAGQEVSHDPSYYNSNLINQVA